jgi:integrase
MTQALTTTIEAQTNAVALRDVVTKASELFDAAQAPNTKRAYDVAWRDFTGWCNQSGLSSLPAEPATVGLYLSALADSHKISTLRLRLAAIVVRHREASLTLDTKSPAITRVMRGIARTNGSAPTRKAAATVEVLRDSVRAYCGSITAKAKRDRALLVIGFYAALRRSELAAINIEDIAVTADGLVLTLHHRKTDAEGQGTTIGLPIKADGAVCPVAAWQAWLAVRGNTEGPAFVNISRGDKIQSNRLSDKDIARTIKSATAAAGYNSADFSGHSLRSGFVTTAARAGVADRLIMKQTGHASLNIMHGYIRRAGLFVENAAALI